MNVTSSSLTGPSTATSGSTTAAGSASRDQFLRLFVAQLENQNPLDPQSGADMVAQLAQFSSVEQAVETNSRLADLIAAQDAAGSAGLAQLVGRDVTADASHLTLDGTPPALELTSDSPIAGATVTIKDADGKTIRTLEVGPGTSPRPLAWDGRDQDGVLVKPGSYSVEVAARDATGAPVSAHPRIHAVVDSLELTASGPLLHLGGARISPAAVTTIARTGV